MAELAHLILAVALAGGTPVGGTPLEPVRVGGTLEWADAVSLIDGGGDAVLRKTTFEAIGDVGEDNRTIPDINKCLWGNYSPTSAPDNLYQGQWLASGDFFRLDVYFLHRVNPPGLIQDVVYDPYRHGDSPVFGTIEIDVDRNIDTGGETHSPADRYLSNVARFGGKPSAPRYTDHVGISGDNDGFVSTPPFVERSGEELHISLLGKWLDEIIEESGDGDDQFEDGETWIARGRFLHRAHVYETFSGAGGDGIYEPVVDLRFKHLPGRDETQLTLVFPLTNDAAATQILPSTAVEPMDGDDSNQSSVLEAVADLVDCLQALEPGDALRLHPDFPLVSEWENRSLPSPTDVGDGSLYGDSSRWHVTLLVGMAYESQDPFGQTIAWTDTLGSPASGDFDGDGSVTMSDVTLFELYLLDNDGNTYVDEGVEPDSVDLINFGPNFSIYDLNYDGIVDGADKCLMPVLGDFDADFVIDMDDMAVFVQTLLNPTLGVAQPMPSCAGGAKRARADFNGDGRIDGEDIQGFVEAITENAMP